MGPGTTAYDAVAKMAASDIAAVLVMENGRADSVGIRKMDADSADELWRSPGGAMVAYPLRGRPGYGRTITTTKRLSEPEFQSLIKQLLNPPGRRQRSKN